jgi:hypothetical protein
MGESAYVASMNRLQHAVGAELKKVGFTTRGRTFNRITDDSLTQVVNFQMAPSDPPGTTHIAGLRENLRGWFTVNLGVYVPEVGLHSGESGRFVQDYHCCVRQRLGAVAPEPKDVWWRIAADHATVADLCQRLADDGMPFLERFGSRERILREWSEAAKNVGAGQPPRIVMAIILAGRGQAHEARRLLRQQAEETPSPGHAAYVRELAMKLGLGPLAS